MLEKLKKFYYSVPDRLLAFFILLIILFVGWYFLFLKFKEEKNIVVKKQVNHIEEKKVILKKQKINIVKKISKKEKYEELKRNLRGEKFLKIFKNYEIFTKNNKNKTFVFLKEKSKKQEIEIIDFDNDNFLNKKTDIFFDKIYGKNKEIFIFKKNILYIYNIENNFLEQINFAIKPEYIKKMSNQKYLIITKKGSFIYNVENKSIDFFYLFKDFVIYKNNYIGIIYNNEKNKKKNLKLEKYNSNILVKFNLETKEKKVVLENIKGFEKIIIEKSKIYIFTSKGKFVLNNL